MTVLLKSARESPVRDACAAHANDPAALIEILHSVQARQGYLSDAALLTIAHALNLSRADIHGVVSFYHDFRREPGPRHRLQVCRAEACQAVGGAALAGHAEAQCAGRDDIALDDVYCLGNCALGPAVILDGVLHGLVDAERLDALLAGLSETEMRS